MLAILCDLLVTFGQIGLLSIGGGYAIIPLIQEQVVNQNGWVSQQTFTDIITISQMTPGPLAVNTSTFVGIQIAGLPGAVVATVGCVASGVVLSTLLYCFFRRHQRSVYVFEVLGGLKAASLGLIVSAAATILLLTFCGVTTLDPGVFKVDWAAGAVFALSLFALRRFKTNPMLLLGVTGLIGCFVYGV